MSRTYKQRAGIVGKVPCRECRKPHWPDSLACGICQRCAGRADSAERARAAAIVATSRRRP